MIYLIRVADTDLYKVGQSAHPQARLADLQATHPQDLHLVRLWPGGPAAEARAHARLKARRVRGEWFDLAGIPDPAAHVGSAVMDADYQSPPLPRGGLTPFPTHLLEA